MIEVIFLSVLAVIWLAFASVQDLRKHEIYNWVGFSLVVFAWGFRFFYGLFSGLGFGFFYQGLIGFIIFFGIGNLLYYSRMFAGGDAKLMYAMGPILPFSLSFITNLKSFGMFLAIFLIAGGIYGLIWSMVLTFMNLKSFSKEFVKHFKVNKRYIWSGVIFGIVFVSLGFFERMFVLLGALIFVMPYFYIYAKAVDEVCMIRRVATGDLTEGDWLYEDIMLGRKKLKADWEGLEMKDIEAIRKKKRFVKIRSGIPFVPVFLIAFFIWLYLFFNSLF